MSYKAKYKQLIYLLDMLQAGRIKTPLEIAEKFNCSDKTARRMVNDLREEGHNITYSKESKKYLLTKQQTVRK